MTFLSLDGRVRLPGWDELSLDLGESRDTVANAVPVGCGGHPFFFLFHHLVSPPYVSRDII